MQNMVTKAIFIEDLIDEHPKSVKFLADKNIKCIACGEPIWGTLEDACKEKNLEETEILLLVKELNNFLNENN